MSEKKFILIGSDEIASLTAIQSSLINYVSYSIVTASRSSDLISISRSLKPALVIIRFRNNQEVINNLTTFNKANNLPILCLTKPFENDKLQWNTSSIVFTEMFDYKNKENFISLKINSILKLISTPVQSEINESFAAESLKSSFVKHNKDLSRLVLELDQKVGTLVKIKGLIKELYSNVDDPVRRELMTIVNSIKVSTSDKKHWDDFKVYFENINPEFIRKLAKRHPSLTEKDIKYCCYLKMNMSNNDIRHLLGINQESVRTHKYRLKKKMALSKEQNLRNYIGSISSRIGISSI